MQNKIVPVLALNCNFYRQIVHVYAGHKIDSFDSSSAAVQQDYTQDNLTKKNKISIFGFGCWTNRFLKKLKSMKSHTALRRWWSINININNKMWSWRRYEMCYQLRVQCHIKYDWRSARRGAHVYLNIIKHTVCNQSHIHTRFEQQRWYYIYISIYIYVLLKTNKFVCSIIIIMAKVHTQYIAWHNL